VPVRLRELQYLRRDAGDVKALGFQVEERELRVERVALEVVEREHAMTNGDQVRSSMRHGRFSPVRSRDSPRNSGSAVMNTKKSCVWVIGL
jgi:hypothetical protein